MQSPPDAAIMTPPNTSTRPGQNSSNQSTNPNNAPPEQHLTNHLRSGSCLDWKILCPTHAGENWSAPDRVLKHVANDGRTRREGTKKRSLHTVNEHFEFLRNAVMPSAVVFQHPARLSSICSAISPALWLCRRRSIPERNSTKIGRCSMRRQ